MIHDLALLHAVFAFAVDQELIQRNPVKVRQPKFDPTKGAQPFEADEIELLAFEARRVINLFSRMPYWIPFLVALRTGLRCSDLISLKWQNVDFERNLIECRCKKNKKVVRIPMLSDLREALSADQEYRVPLSTNHVLLNPRTERPFRNDKADFWKYVSDLGKRAGVVRAHPHRFRDTFAIHLSDTATSRSGGLGSGLPTIHQVNRFHT